MNINYTEQNIIKVHLITIAKIILKKDYTEEIKIIIKSQILIKKYYKNSIFFILNKYIIYIKLILCV